MYEDPLTDRPFEIAPEILFVSIDPSTIACTDLSYFYQLISEFQ